MNGLFLSPNEIQYYKWAIALLKESKYTSILGDWAMGKSTFAVNLGNITNQDVVHLNMVRDVGPFQKMPLKQSLYLYGMMTKHRNCILDGNAVDLELDERLEKSDAIVFFDGNTDDIISNFMTRLAKVFTGQEQRIGAHEFEGTESFNRINEILTRELETYKINKEMIKSKLKFFENKVVTVKNNTEVNNINVLIGF